MNPERAEQRADELATRLELRMRLLDQEESLKALPPKVVGAALVVPIGLIDDSSPEPTGPGPGRDEVERRAMAAVLDVEAAVGHIARDMNDEHRNHPGYDVQSLVPASGDRTDRLLFIEVKGRIEASETVTVSRNEILTALNAPDQFVLALVEVSRSGQRHDRVRYLSRPFEGIGVTHFAETSRNFAWTKLWELGSDPREHFAGDAGTDDDLRDA